MNQKKLTRLQNLLQEMTDTGFISGVNCMVIQNGTEQCYYEAGFRDISGKLPITRDTIFRLYSMSKPVTSAAVMILLEEGRLDLLDPVSKFLPGFQNPYKIVDGMAVPVTRPVTIQNLLNMTSGLVYLGEGNPAEVRSMALFEEMISGLDEEKPITTQEFANRLGRLPLAFAPGERWQYGASADVLGAVIEVVTGMSFGEFLAERIFKPLGMKDTGFYVPAEKQYRLAKVYQATENGLTENTYSHLGIRHHMDTPPAFESGGAGLASTIDDYARFAQMLLNKGSLEGAKILSPKTVEFMTNAHLTPTQQTYVNQWESLPGYTYANLLRIMKDPDAAVFLGSKGEYGWDGWLGTYFMNDPAHNLTFLIMHQKTDSGTTTYTRKLRNVLFSALED